MRPETQRGVEALLAGIVVSALELLVLSERFSTPQGRGGITLLLGSVFVTGIVWWMLALRTLANDGALAPEVDDGFACMAAMAWVMVALPPRASNFFETSSVDDFTRVYVPASLVVVFAVLLAQKLWPVRAVRASFARLTFGTGATLLACAALLMTVGRGDDAALVAVRSTVLGALAVVASVVLGGRPRAPWVS